MNLTDVIKTFSIACLLTFSMFSYLSSGYVSLTYIYGFVVVIPKTAHGAHNTPPPYF